MTVKNIEEKHGLPARIKIPVPIIVINGYGKQELVGYEYLLRTITKKLENGDYLQYDESQPSLGEFVCCYEKEVAERYHNDWEYVGKPETNQLPLNLGE